jgi:hypothetical protein
MHSKKTKKPWWITSVSLFDVMFTPDAIKQATDHKLHALTLDKIASAVANKPFPTRPKRARHKWLEQVIVDGVRYELSCCVDDYENHEFIVVSNIRIHKKYK